MGDGRCHNGRQQQRRHNPNGWWCNGWQDGSNSAMAIAMNGGGSKEGNGDGDEGGGRVAATKRAMAMAIRVAGNEEGNDDNGKSNGGGIEGGGRWRWQ
jgi:hypothetical protein